MEVDKRGVRSGWLLERVKMGSVLDTGSTYCWECLGNGLLDPRRGSVIRG